MVQAQATMRRIGLELIEEKRRAAIAEQSLEEAQFGNVKASPAEASSAKDIKGKDILSILIRSNLSSIPEQRMSIEEILCQISTFLAAGHETTGSALTWCLYALSKDPDAQEKLRNALRALDPEDVSQNRDADAFADLTDRVARCEYLDWVVRESLRLHAPVTSTMRVCMREEDEIPMQGSFEHGVPNKSVLSEDGTAGYVDKNGRRRWTIPVRKWDIISVPIQAINKSEAFWGPDAAAFRPERWAAPPQGARAIPGLYSNILTFLNGNPLGGNRACIGYKFALLE
ncbi:cytochrome P450 [Pholiota conissans]|uniref:Cytochrome P450 n=1 Tax=Pholiota conissans TaxID=109636 RepID=A0A9P6D7P9_9AGAR|nr:cytochrome P450 [Pholiota conissans]